jgi:dihydrofolate reductase
MRKVIFGGANSLDNYLARPDGAVDWILWGDEAAELMKDMWSRFDTIVMGRKTYEHGKKSAPEGAKNPFAGIRTVVFSTTLDPASETGVEVVSTDPGEFVRGIKAEDGNDICVMGGGELGKTLLEAGVIDEIGFNVHPVLLGEGIPLFHKMDRQIDLELTECRAFKNGCVYLHYRVKN